MFLGEVLEARDLDLPESKRAESVGLAMTLLFRGLMPDEGGFHKMRTKVIEEFELTYLSDLLSTHQGNISKAARAAKKERQAFQRLLQKHGLDQRVFSAN